MDELIRRRLERNALAIEKFRNLSTDDQEWLLPLLSKGVRNTLMMLELISDERLTFEQIGRQLGVSPQTVTQKLNTLAKGGMAIDLTDTAALAPTGRPRKLAAKN